jgi:hypothetical protein
MQRRDFTSKLLAGLVAVPVLGATSGQVLAQNERFSIVADLAECCSCEIPCPCNFGRPTELRCDGNRLIQIRSGHFEGADLAGINFLVTFLMGNWTRIHIDESMSAAQQASFDRMFPVIFAGFNNLARAKHRVPLNIARGENVITFSVPESTVEMKLLPGLGGEPIVIDNLPNPAYHEYVQYESVNHRHSSVDADWAYSGSNGFTSVMRVSG